MDAAVSFPKTPSPVKAVTLKLSKRMNVEQAFEAIVRACLEQIRANQAGVARFHDAESLHQMRVGLRRLDAALTLFADAVCIPKDIEHEVAWLRDELGPVRDWDVLLETTLPRVGSALAAPDTLSEVQKAAQNRVHGLHQKAGTAVASERFERLVEGIDSWLDQRGWRQQLSGKAKALLKLRATGFASTILEQGSARLLKRGARLKGADESTRHRVRIAAKRARYAAEFFASLYRGKQVRSYVKALSILQEHLGWLNDAAVAGRLLQELAEGDDGLREGAAMVHGYLAGAVEQDDRKARKLWRNIVSIKPPH